MVGKEEWNEPSMSLGKGQNEGNEARWTVKLRYLPNAQIWAGCDNQSVMKWESSLAALSLRLVFKLRQDQEKANWRF